MASSAAGPWRGTAGASDSWATVALAQSLNVTSSVNSNTLTTASTANLAVGQQLSGGNVPAGSFITAITNATTFTISQNASATGTTTANTVNAGIAPLTTSAYTVISTTGSLAAATTASANYSVSATAGTVSLLAASGTNTVNSSAVRSHGSCGPDLRPQWQ